MPTYNLIMTHDGIGLFVKDKFEADSMEDAIQYVKNITMVKKEYKEVGTVNIFQKDSKTPVTLVRGTDF